MPSTVPDEIRRHYEPVAGALSDIGNALGLLEMVLDQLHDRMPEVAGEQIGYLIFAAEKAQREATDHIKSLWLAVGGRGA